MVTGKLPYILILALMISGCGQMADSGQTDSDLYAEVFKTMMAEDPGLSDGAAYIALDFSELPGPTDSLLSATEEAADEPGDEKETVSDETAEAVIEELEQEYGVDVIRADLEELKEQGLFNEETLSLEGVLLEIQDFRFTGEDEAVLEVQKYASGLGAIGLEITVIKEGETWSADEVKMLWIS